MCELGPKEVFKIIKTSTQVGNMTEHELQVFGRNAGLWKCIYLVYNYKLADRWCVFENFKVGTFQPQQQSSANSRRMVKSLVRSPSLWNHFVGKLKSLPSFLNGFGRQVSFRVTSIGNSNVLVAFHENLTISSISAAFPVVLLSGGREDIIQIPNCHGAYGWLDFQGFVSKHGTLVNMSCLYLLANMLETLKAERFASVSTLVYLMSIPVVTLYLAHDESITSHSAMSALQGVRTVKHPTFRLRLLPVITPEKEEDGSVPAASARHAHLLSRSRNLPSGVNNPLGTSDRDVDNFTKHQGGSELGTTADHSASVGLTPLAGSGFTERAVIYGDVDSGQGLFGGRIRHSGMSSGFISGGEDASNQGGVVYKAPPMQALDRNEVWSGTANVGFPRKGFQELHESESRRSLEVYCTACLLTKRDSSKKIKFPSVEFLLPCVYHSEQSWLLYLLLC